MRAIVGTGVQPKLRLIGRLLLERQTLLVISGVLLAGGWVTKWAGLNEAFFQVAMVLATLAAGLPIAREAWAELRFRTLGIKTLVTLAAIGAIVIGEPWEAGAVTFLFGFGGFLERRTLAGTRRILGRLLSWNPTRMMVRRGGETVEVGLEDVVAGDVVIIRSGDKIPIDGRVVTGSGSVNQAMVTGESIPVEKVPGDNVISGSLNEAGYLEVEVTRVGKDTTFAKVTELVLRAQEEKTRLQSVVERFAVYYTPGVIMLAIMTFLFTRDLKLALTLLVVACPGALVMAAPVSIMAGIGNAALHGVLIKGGATLETLARVDTVAFDKTGTLSKGRPEVVLVEAVDGRSSENDVLRWAAAVERASEHHLAKAILERARRLPPEFSRLPDATDVKVWPGRGISGNVAGKRVFVGTTRALAELGVPFQESLTTRLAAEEEKGRTIVLVVHDDHVAGLIAIADVAREEAAAMIQALRRIGIKRTAMLTGDSRRVAAAFGRQLGIDAIEAELLPEQKYEAIRRTRASGSHVVAMVGDGINDAPALAEANVGIAMGLSGTDLALETADVTLMTDNLDKIPFALGLGRAIVRNIRQNIALAVAVVGLLLAGVFTGKVFLASGMLVHEASVIVVILNGMRLLFYGRRFKKGHARKVSRSRPPAFLSLPLP